MSYSRPNIRVEMAGKYQRINRFHYHTKWCGSWLEYLLLCNIFSQAVNTVFYFFFSSRKANKDKILLKVHSTHTLSADFLLLKRIWFADITASRKGELRMGIMGRRGQRIRNRFHHLLLSYVVAFVVQHRFP